jgi:hypothetical protein
MNHRSLSSLSAALVAGALALAGCAPRPDLPSCGTPGGVACDEVQTWDFERGCADDLCGFTQLAGQARRVTPYGPGEHVMELSQGALVQAAVSLPAPSTQEAVGLLARCEPGTSLRVEETAYAWGQDAAGAAVPEAREDREQARPGAEWESLNVRFAARGAGEFSQRVLLRLGTDGPGSCSVDEISFGALDPNRVEQQ